MPTGRMIRYALTDENILRGGQTLHIRAIPSTRELFRTALVLLRGHYYPRLNRATSAFSSLPREPNTV